MKKKRYLIEVEETTGYLGGEPRIAGTRIPLARFVFLKEMRAKKTWPYIFGKQVKRLTKQEDYFNDATKVCDFTQMLLKEKRITKEELAKCYKGRLTKQK